MELASRKQRFLAALTDGVIVGVPYVLGAYEAVPDPLRLIGVVASLALLIVQLIMVSKHGQTLGKRMCKIRVVKADGFALDAVSVFMRNVFRVADHLPIL